MYSSGVFTDIVYFVFFQSSLMFVLVASDDILASGAFLQFYHLWYRKDNQNSFQAVQISPTSSYGQKAARLVSAKLGVNCECFQYLYVFLLHNRVMTLVSSVGISSKISTISSTSLQYFCFLHQ